MDINKKEFGNTLLRLAKEILEKEEEQRSKVEQDFLSHIDLIINYYGRENDGKCRNMM